MERGEDSAKDSEDVEQQELLVILLMGLQIVQSVLKTVWRFLTKLIILLP